MVRAEKLSLVAARLVVSYLLEHSKAVCAFNNGIQEV